MLGRDFAGLGLATDFGLPELGAAERHPPFDLILVGEDVALPSPATVVHQWMSGTGVSHLLARTGGTYVLEFDDGSVFAFDDDTRTVRCPTALDSTRRHQLLDQVLPRVLDHLGHLMIHGSAIEMPSGAVVFIGDSGRGKSTLAASFHSAGIGVLSDDCLRLMIDVDVVCVPTYPSLRLWSDSADAIMTNAASVPMTGNTSKQRIELPAPPPVRSTAVAAVCVLAAPTDASSAVAFAAVPPARAVSLLLAQCFRLDPTDESATARAFERCVDVVERVPIVELRYPRDYGRLPEVRNAVLEQAASDGWAEVTAR